MLSSAAAAALASWQPPPLLTAALIAGHQIERGLSDCGTRHGVYAEITTEDHASRLVGRYYRLSEDGPWELVRTRQDATRLVGETVVLRSPITCAGEHGVCHKCYGELHRSNENIHAGIYGVLIISEQITQRLLSSKHLLKARPTKIEWPQAFLDHFSVDRATITADSSVDRVMIALDDVIEDDEEHVECGSGRNTVVLKTCFLKKG